MRRRWTGQTLFGVSLVGIMLTTFLRPAPGSFCTRGSVAAAHMSRNVTNPVRVHTSADVAWGIPTPEELVRNAELIVLGQVAAPGLQLIIATEGGQVGADMVRYRRPLGSARECS